MGSHNRNGSVRSKMKKKSSKSPTFPEVYIDQDADFASIKLAPGIEAKSFVKDGFVFCQDKKGQIIEIQVLNLSDLKPKRSAA
ncbi:MAG: hypothetical protein IPK04_15560 [Bdellovibrionales bacterium]|nr:hypothetical protein [Bdellovibrionales bacterium]